MGSDSHRALEAWCSQRGALQAQKNRGLGFSDGDIAGRSKFPSRFPNDWRRRLLTLLATTPRTK